MTTSSRGNGKKPRPKRRPQAVEDADFQLQHAVVRGEPPEVLEKLRRALRCAERKPKAA